MTNQGVYREPGAVGGLPLPRAGLATLTAVVASLALVAAVAAPLLLAVVGHSASGAWSLFRNGGAAMWIVLLLDGALPVGLALAGALVLRGKRVPAALLFVAAALPMFVALLGAWYAQKIVLSAISGEGVDPEQKARILAEGLAESMALDIFGGFVTCGAAIVAAAAAASALASIDVRAASRAGPTPPSFNAIATGAASAAWLVAALGLGAVRARTAGGLMLLPALPILVLAPFAALAARGARTLRAWHDRTEAACAASALLVASLCALLAVLALQRAVEATFASRALEAISGETVDELQRGAILSTALDAGRLAPASYALHAVLGGATFGFALIGGIFPLRAGAALAVAVAALLLTSTFALARARSSAPAEMAAHTTAGPEGVALPVVVDTFSHKGVSSRGEHVVIKRDGTGAGDLSGSSCGQRATIYADRAATLAMVRARLPRGDACSTPLVFVATREHPPDVDARARGLAAYLGRTAYISATLGEETAADLRVRAVGDDVIEIDGERIALPLAPDAKMAGSLDAPVSQISYTFRPSDSVDHVVRAVLAVEALYAPRIKTWSLERVMAIDGGSRAPPAGFAQPIEDTPGGATTVRPGALSVNGRLPPEVIERIVRHNLGRVRFCYENGLRAHPALRGRVVVKLVIDRTGAVASAADAGSDLPDNGVVRCVVKSFAALTFPQPEGGIVTVLYPFVFAPTSG